MCAIRAQGTHTLTTALFYLTNCMKLEYNKEEGTPKTNKKTEVNERSNIMTYATLEELLRGSMSVKLNHNTYAQRRGPECIAVQFHATDILLFFKDGRLRLTSGGYRTRITLDRIHASLPDGCTLLQRKGRWFLDLPEKKGVPFEDGIEIAWIDGTWQLISDLDEECRLETEHLLRKIDDYCHHLTNKIIAQAKEDQEGDCFDCGLYTVDGKRPAGDVFNNHAHLLVHIEEPYYPYALLINAYLDKQVRFPEYCLKVDSIHRKRQVLRLYLRKRLLSHA